MISTPDIKESDIKELKKYTRFFNYKMVFKKTEIDIEKIIMKK